MHKHALTLPLLLASSLVAQGYSSDLEALSGSAAGTPVTGQDGYYIPVVGSLDWNVFTYAGNALNVPANPNGGAQFMAGVSQATNIFARTQRPVTVPTNALVYVQFDILCNYVGTGTPTNNIGSFSFQPSTTSVYVNLLARWPTGASFPPATWNADFVSGPTAAGSQTTNPDPNFLNLPVGVWHTWGCVIDLAAGVHREFRITNGATNVTSVFVPPTPIPLPGQNTPLPTDFRFFAGGSNNLLAIDNVIISYGASSSAYGNGCAGSLGVPSLASTSAPRLGSSIGATIGNLPLGVAVMATGFSDTSALGGAIPLPFPLAGQGFPGCDLLADPLVTQIVIGAGNSASWGFALPNNGALAGLRFYNQAISLDIAAPGGAFSNGLASVVGY